MGCIFSLPLKFRNKIDVLQSNLRDKVLRLTNKHTSHEISSLKEASKQLASQVTERFSKEVVAGISIIQTLLNTTKTNIEKLQEYEQKFTQELDKIFEELFMSLRESYLTLKEQSIAKFKLSYSKLDSNNSQIQDLESWSERLLRAHIQSTDNQKIMLQQLSSGENTVKQDDNISKAHSSSFQNNLQQKESIILNSNLLDQIEQFSESLSQFQQQSNNCSSQLQGSQSSHRPSNTKSQQLNKNQSVGNTPDFFNQQSFERLRGQALKRLNLKINQILTNNPNAQKQSFQAPPPHQQHQSLSIDRGMQDQQQPNRAVRQSIHQHSFNVGGNRKNSQIATNQSKKRTAIAGGSLMRLKLDAIGGSNGNNLAQSKSYQALHQNQNHHQAPSSSPLNSSIASTGTGMPIKQQNFVKKNIRQMMQSSSGLHPSTSAMISSQRQQQRGSSVAVTQQQQQAISPSNRAANHATQIRAGSKHYAAPTTVSFGGAQGSHGGYQPTQARSIVVSSTQRQPQNQNNQPPVGSKNNTGTNSNKQRNSNQNHQKPIQQSISSNNRLPVKQKSHPVTNLAQLKKMTSAANAKTNIGGENEVDLDDAQMIVMDEEGDSARQSASISEWKAAGNLTKRSLQTTKTTIAATASNYTTSSRQQPQQQVQPAYAAREENTTFTEQQQQMAERQQFQQIMRMRKSASRKRWDLI